MKKYIKSMGMNKPAQERSHINMSPTISKKTFSSILDVGLKIHNTTLIEEIIKVVIMDIKADIKANTVDLISIKAFYYDYYDYVKSIGWINQKYITMLHKLVK